MPELDDLQPTEIANGVARATTPAPFGDLVVRARRRRHVVVASAAAVVLVIGGGTAVVAALTSGHPSSSSVVHPGPNTNPVVSCGSDACLHIPRASQRVTRAAGDFDGDGRVDTFVVYAYPVQHGFPVAWNAQVNLADGRTLNTTLPQNHNGQDLVAAVVDANRDGRAEAFVRVWSGAADGFYQIYGLSGGQLAPVRFADGRTVRLYVGGSVGSGGGVSCHMNAGSPQFVITSFFHLATIRGGPGTGLGRWHRTTYAWRGDVLFRTASVGGILEAGIRAADPYLRFDCFGATLAPLPKVIPIPPFH